MFDKNDYGCLMRVCCGVCIKLPLEWWGMKWWAMLKYNVFEFFTLVITLWFLSMSVEYSSWNLRKIFYKPHKKFVKILK